MKTKILLIPVSLVVLVISGKLFAAPPVPFLHDDEPGVYFPFTGDPDTTETSVDPNTGLLVIDCAQGAVRATQGDPSGKNHNELMNCDNWDFKPQQWGEVAFLQGAFVLSHSPFSDDGAWDCPGNKGPGTGVNPCVNSTVRAVPTFKNQSAPGFASGVSMDTSKDWVFSFDFHVTIPAGDTFGNDKLFELSVPILKNPGSGSTDSQDVVQILGAGPGRGTYVPGIGEHRYFVNVGPWPEGMTERQLYDRNIESHLIDRTLEEGKITVHYKASNELLDLYIDNELVVENFASVSGSNEANFIQLGGGGISFENALYDNVLMGVLADSGACGPQGPGSSVPGDFNCDGAVDVADLGIIGANFNDSTVTYSDGDANLDGAVDVADLGVVGANWTAAQSGSLAQALESTGLVSLVPEPTSVALVVAGFSYLGCRRSR